MALNLIKVQPKDEKGVYLIAISAIAKVTSTETRGSIIQFTDGSKLEVIDSIQAVFDAANRRPPDGN